MSKNIDKRLWGVLGKQQTYYSPQKQIEGKNKEPLNANAFESWDAKRSNYKRIDGVPNNIQQQGVVPQGTSPVPSPTATPIPASPTPTPSITPSSTPTYTPTNTPTPSATLPIISNYLLAENSDEILAENGDNLEVDVFVPTPSPTPSSTPTIKEYNLRTVYAYAADGATNISGCNGDVYLNGVQMNFWHSLGTAQNEFSANTFYLTGNIELSIIPVPGYECAYDGTTPIYDRMTMTGWTRTINNSTQERWQGTTKFWTGDTQVAYTENEIGRAHV